MAKNTIAFKTKGMNRDMSVSSFNPEFSFENKNIRLSTAEGNTMMSWVTERGPKKLVLSILDTDGETVLKTINGIPIGTAVINHQLVLFVHDPNAGDNIPDSIYVLKRETDTTVIEEELYGVIGIRLFHGNLNFSQDYPLETLVSYESENVQKVYWTDNYNQPRVINIAAKDGKVQAWNKKKDLLYTAFDFAPEIRLDSLPQVSVQKVIGGGGSFAAGVIQYALTYYNKYGQETAIFRVTPLLYVSYSDRGVAPDDTVDNVFKITLSGLDTSFDYVRIYSIQRTSLNDTPITKRVQDIYIGNATAVTVFTYTDTGYNGNSIDPTELLYKGSEDIRVKTIEQKDGTLFLGSIKENYTFLDDTIKDIVKSKATVISSDRDIRIEKTNSYNSGYIYYNQLNAYILNNKGLKMSVPCGGFKTGDYYRLGLQFQYKTGKWSEPVWVGDYYNEERPYDDDNGVVTLPAFEVSYRGVTIEENGNTISMVEALRNRGYRYVRPVVVFPEPQDRVTLCQGVACPTVTTTKQKNEQKVVAQSSWLFRTSVKNDAVTLPPMNTETGAVVPLDANYLASPNLNDNKYNPNKVTESSIGISRENIRQMEIEGLYTEECAFQVNRSFYTFHTPELEFDEFRAGIDLTGVSYQTAGYAYFAATYSDIDIQTKSPTISDEGSGFIHKSFTSFSENSPKDEGQWKDQGNYGIVSGLFYNDYIVDDGDKLKKYSYEKKPVNWMVYLWHATESLNNDINRPSDEGTATAVLQKKIISNLRYGKYSAWRKIDWADTRQDRNAFENIPQIFDSEECTIVKLGDGIYKGNIDTLLVPSEGSGKFFACPSNNEIKDTIWADTENKFTSDINWKTYANDDNSDKTGLYRYTPTGWENKDRRIGDDYASLSRKKNSVRMKYKSSPHIALGNLIFPNDLVNHTVPIIELVRTVNSATLFGGVSEDAFKENTWVPCGEPVWLSSDPDENEIVVNFEYGDTYYQRWDCLKTYPSTSDDINQLVEIVSFALETRYNIAGRYDRNRGQLSNLHMNPGNFNLFNPVYSQVDNFFSYKITDEDTYENNFYPNQLTWTLIKNSNADVDEWTHITLANTLELDGDKGSLNKIVRYNNMLLAFQDTGISQILYNENAQISTTEGVPIEIANSGKVQGKRYLSSTKGCANKWALQITPSGVYFIDSYDRSINVLAGEGLQSLSTTLGFDSWCKQNILNPTEHAWTPQDYNDFTAYYDRINQDVLFINHDTALAYSERFSVFTSFYDYGGTPYFINLDNTAIWITCNFGKSAQCAMWEHNKGEYCSFFNKEGQPYWMTFIGNPEPQKSKVFTNLEIQATVDGDGEANKNSFTLNLPFASLETWNEYQHGYTKIKHLTGVAALRHKINWSDDNSLKRRFRIWWCDIPRDNTVPDALRKPSISYPYSTDKALNCSRVSAKPLDRMRNPWLYLQLKGEGNNARTEIHDVVMTYYS